MKRVGEVLRDDLRDGKMVRLDYPPNDVLVAEVDGTLVAIEDACNHAGASLCDGPREGDCVSCPLHGYIFELGTGKLVEPEGLCEDQRAFRVTVEGPLAVVWDPFVLRIV